MRFQRPINSLKEDFKALGLLREEKKEAPKSEAKPPVVESKATAQASPLEERKARIRRHLRERTLSERKKKMVERKKGRMKAVEELRKKRSCKEEIEAPKGFEDRAEKIAEQIKGLRAALSEKDDKPEIVRAFENVQRLAGVLLKKFSAISEQEKKAPAEKVVMDPPADEPKKEKKEGEEDPDDLKKKAAAPAVAPAKAEAEGDKEDEAEKVAKEDADEDEEEEEGDPEATPPPAPVESKEVKKPVVTEQEVKPATGEPAPAMKDYVQELEFVGDKTTKILDALKKQAITSADAEGVLKDLVSYLGGVAQDYADLLKYKKAGEGEGYSEVK